MNWRGRIDILEWSLMALCLALVATIGVELNRNPGMPVQATQTPLSPPTAGELPYAAIKFPPLARYSTVIERPLFSSSRRPAPVDNTSARADGALELRHLVLTGVLMVGPGEQLAILLDRTRSEQLRVRKGGDVSGWSLAEVRADGVTLRKGSAMHVIPLYEEKGSSGSGAAPVGYTIEPRAQKP